MTFEEIKGKEARDTVTGFSGKITAMCFYIDGYNSVKIDKLLSDGKLASEWFNIDVIEIIQ